MTKMITNDIFLFIKNISNSLEKAPQLGNLIVGGVYSWYYGEVPIKITISCKILVQKKYLKNRNSYLHLK